MIANMENDNMVLPKFTPLKYKKGENGQGGVQFHCQSLNYEDRIYKFPSKAKTAEEKQAQKMNYDYFIQTMTELVKKYASDMED